MLHVTLIAVSWKYLVASSRYSSFTTCQLLCGFAKYPYAGPREEESSHLHTISAEWPRDLAAWWMSGNVAMAYIAIAKGSPCVVPSFDIYIRCQ